MPLGSLRTNGAPDRKILAAAKYRDIFPAAGFGFAGQQAPGLSVSLVFAVSAAAWVEVHAQSPLESLDRHDVPDILLHHMRRDEVDVVLGITSSGGSGSCLVSPMALGGSALYLDPPKPPTHSHQHIVRIDVFPKAWRPESLARMLLPQKPPRPRLPYVHYLGTLRRGS